jgi:hypothetical protein
MDCDNGAVLLSEEASSGFSDLEGDISLSFLRKVFPKLVGNFVVKCFFSRKAWQTLVIARFFSKIGIR